jgi:hypothetical protein
MPGSIVVAHDAQAGTPHAVEGLAGLGRESGRKPVTKHVRKSPKLISTQRLRVTAVWLAVSGSAVSAQTPATPVNRVENVARLLKELRWSTNEGHEDYLRIKNDTTKRLLTEVDGFIAEAFSPRSTTTDQVRAGLDALLNNAKGSMQQSVAFPVNLPIGHFLIIGVEIPRGGGAIPEDAISFRAYREAGDHFQAVADVDYPRDGPPYDSVEILAFVNAKPLSSQPIGTEFWFMAWAQLPSASSPPIVTTRLFGFHGERFRTLWTTDPFNTPYIDQAVEITRDGGFTLRTMPNSRAFTIINKRYAVTADGPQKVTEWETQER